MKELPTGLAHESCGVIDIFEHVERRNRRPGQIFQTVAERVLGRPSHVLERGQETRAPTKTHCPKPSISRGAENGGVIA